MIDIENTVYTAVRTALKTYSSAIVVASDYFEMPENFPFVTVVEEDNAEYKRTELGTEENHAVLTYDINVYTSGQGRKTLAKQIMGIADTVMLGMKFERLSLGFTPNVDRTVCRYTARYRAVVSKGETSGTNTAYRIYKE